MQPKFINRIQWPAPGQYIIAVSGGVDSVALLHLMAARQMQQGWSLRVAHVNHGWRPDASADQRLVRDIARVYNLPFHTTTLSLTKKNEESARQARYDFLQGLVTTYGADAIVTAHHQDDRHETTWFQLARGSGRRGATSLRQSDTVLRPLLGVRKAELTEYATAQGLPWRPDSTNSDITLGRNFVRHELMPLARQEVPEFDDQLDARLAELAAVNGQIDQKISGLLKVSGTAGEREVLLAKSEAAKLNPARLAEVVVVMIKILEPGLQLASGTVKRLALLAKTGRPGQEHSISATMMAAVTRQGFMVSEVRESVQDLLAQELIAEGSIRFGNHQLSYGSVCLDEGHPHIKPLEIKVRRVLPGDRIDPVGTRGTKKLQDLFVDAKIDRDRRAAWPVVAQASDNQVVWVPRLAISRSLSLKSKAANSRCLIHQFL